MRLNSSQRMKKMFYDHEIGQNHDTRLKLTMKARLKSNLAKILHQMQQRMWPTWTQDKHRVGTHCQKDNQWSQIVWLQKAGAGGGGGGWFQTWPPKYTLSAPQPPFACQCLACLKYGRLHYSSPWKHKRSVVLKNKMKEIHSQVLLGHPPIKSLKIFH